MSDVAIVVFGLFFGFMLFMLIASVIYQRRIWNKGVSKHDGTRWKLFDIDSQGGRGYVDESGNYIWIDVPFLDKT